MSTAIEVNEPLPIDADYFDEPSFEKRPWHPLRRFAFRFAFIYFVIYAMPLVWQYIPSELGFVQTAAGYFSGWWTNLWTNISGWVASTVFGVDEVPMGPSGSGDRIYNFVMLFTTTVLSLLGAVIWTLVDLRRRSYPHMGSLLTWACRFYLGITLCSYGFFKVIPTQFVPPSIENLMTEHGQKSPMGVLWDFMGVSPGYTMFTGWAEVIAGTLLFFNNTRTLGALMAIGVMGNVAMLNFCYDVPVKLFSTHLLLMAIILAALDGRRVFNAFVLGRATQSQDMSSPFSRGVFGYVALLIKFIIIGGIWYQQINMSLNFYDQRRGMEERVPLYGLYDVQSFEMDGQELPPLLTDPVRWQNMVIESAGELKLRKMDDTFVRFDLVTDTEAQTVTITSRDEARAQSVLSYAIDDAGVMTLTGNWRDAPVVITLVKRDLNEYELVREPWTIFIVEDALNR